MYVIYSKWTYEELGRPMPGREGGKPLNVVSPKAIEYDQQTQKDLYIDEAVNADLCADLMARAGAYWVDAAGELNVDVDWSEDI